MEGFSKFQHFFKNKGYFITGIYITPKKDNPKGQTTEQDKDLNNYETIYVKMINNLNTTFMVEIPDSYSLKYTGTKGTFIKRIGIPDKCKYTFSKLEKVYNRIRDTNMTIINITKNYMYVIKGKSKGSGIIYRLYHMYPLVTSDSRRTVSSKKVQLIFKEETSPVVSNEDPKRSLKIYIGKIIPSITVVSLWYMNPHDFTKLIDAARICILIGLKSTVESDFFVVKDKLLSILGYITSTIFNINSNSEKIHKALSEKMSRKTELINLSTVEEDSVRDTKTPQFIDELRKVSIEVSKLYSELEGLELSGIDLLSTYGRKIETLSDSIVKYYQTPKELSHSAE